MEVNIIGWGLAPHVNAKINEVVGPVTINSQQKELKYSVESAIEMDHENGQAFEVIVQRFVLANYVGGPLGQAAIVRDGN